jgi:hypothetical protein
MHSAARGRSGLRIEDMSCSDAARVHMRLAYFLKQVHARWQVSLIWARWYQHRVSFFSKAAE